MVFSKNTVTSQSDVKKYPIKHLPINKDYIKYYQNLNATRFSLYNNIQTGCSNCYK
jgi:hypothetical protein